MKEKQLDLAQLEDRILFDVAPLDAQAMEPVVESYDMDSEVDLFNWMDTDQSSQSLFSDSQVAAWNAEASAEQQLDEIESLFEAEIDSDIAIDIAVQYKQLIVVDQGVDNYLDLIDAAIGSNPPEQFEIMLIDSSESALQRINDRLSETSYSAIHLVAHGQDGELSLGNEVWNRNFVAQNTSEFATWNQTLSVEADLLIYGCNVAETELGTTFLNELSTATGLDIAASSDLSGATELGGDWDLEYQVGTIEHSLIFDASTDSYWVGLLDVTATGGTTVTTAGLNDGTSHDAVAIAADGDYVMTWTQEGTADGAQVYAQMFNADGTEKAAAFVVNETDAGDQEFASVASDADGNFVIVWTDTSTETIYGKRYANDGSVVQSEFMIDNQAIGATVAMNDSGQFVFAWEETNHTWHIKAQSYDASGAIVTSKFTVNSDDWADVSDASVDINSSGDFAVSWTRDESFDDVYVASFDINGGRNYADDIVVADIPFVPGSFSDVSINDSGTVAVSYSTFAIGTTFANVKIINSDGSNGNFYGPVSDTTSGNQTNTSVDLANNGDFVVVWEGNGVSDSDGIHGKVYDAGLDQFTAEVTANSYTTGDQSNASFAINDAGDFVLVYSGDGLGGSTIFVSASLVPNLPPSGSDNTIQTSEDVTTTISLSDFGYTDNEGDPLAKVKILSLPANGTLLLNGVAVSVNDEILESEISANQLTFDPNTGFAGEADFQFQVFDDNSGAIATNTLTINVQEDIEVTFDEDFDYSFSATDFSSVLTIDHVEIISLPENGVLKLSGAAVSSGQTISKADLDAGNLVFEPAENQFGAPFDSFQFRIFDGSEYTEELSTSIVLNSDFSSNANGFTYDDATFGGTDDNDVSGSYDPSGGNVGGALVVEFSGTGGGSTISGGWSQSIVAAENTLARITIDYRAELAGRADDGEYAEAVMEINGVRVGSGTGSSLVRLNGVDGNGPDDDTGWQTATFEVNLIAGANSIAIGGTNNYTNGNSEWAKVSFDNVFVETLTFTEFEINVNSVDDAPTDISLDNQSVDENDAGAVIGNLTTIDPDPGATVTYSVDDTNFEVVGGALKLKDGISLDREATNSVTVQITAEDNDGLQRVEDFTISVNNINESPTAISLSNQSVDENAVGAILGAVSISDPDVGDSHTYTLSDGRFDVVGGNLQLKSGQFLNHEVDDGMTLNIIATDANGLDTNQDFTITVNDVNEAPTNILLDNVSVDENSDGGVIGNFTVSDVDAGDTHTYVVDDSRFEVVGGQLKLKAGNSLNHEVEDEVLISVEATDLGGETVDVNFTISVNDINEAPHSITLDNLTVDENAVNANIGNLGSTDEDAGDTITYTVSDNRFEVVSGSVLRLKAGVSLDYEIDPTVALTITATDAAGLTSNEGFTISVNDINETNTAHAFSNSYTVVEDNSLGGNLIDDNTGDGVDYGFGALVLNTTPIALPANGTVTFLSDGNFSYSPDPDFAGNDSFQYEISDANGAVSTATVNVTVTAVNDAPNDIDLTNLNIDENSANNTLIGTVTVDDVDLGDTFTYTLLDSADNRFSINSSGELRVADGARLDFEDSETHTIEVEVEDAAGATRTETFTIQLQDVNEVPVAVNDAVSVNEDQSVTISVASLLSNDSDPEGFGTISFDSVDPASPTQGTLIDNGDNTFSYTPNANYFGNDSFQYTIRDAGGETSTATVDITIDPVNDAPVAVGESTTTAGNDSISVSVANLLQNDSDTEGAGLTLELVGGPANGTVAIENGRVVYTPNSGFVGQDRIFYRVSDGALVSNTVSIDIAVTYAPVESGASDGFETAEAATAEEEIVLTEQVDEVEEIVVEAELGAIIDADEDDEAVLQQLGLMAAAQSIENELGLRSDSENDVDETYQFSSNVKDSHSFGNDLETYGRFRVASDRDFENYSSSTIDFQTAEEFDFSHLSQDLDNFDHSFEIEGSVDQVTFATLSSITGALTVGYVLWMVRGGMLMASFVSSIPAWQSIDPLNIVEFGSIGGGDVDEESLESIVTQYSSQA